MHRRKITLSLAHEVSKAMVRAGPISAYTVFYQRDRLPHRNRVKSKERDLLAHRRSRFIIVLETSTQTGLGWLTSESSPSLILFTQYPVFANYVQ